MLATEDRDSYQARKLSLNISADNRVGAYLLVPKGPGPFPAVVALHDHGAHFSIGKEKVVKPFGVSDERMADAKDWVNKFYGSQWFGDRLAERGYVVLATDVLFWGDRGRRKGSNRGTTAPGANMLQLGVSWAGTTCGTIFAVPNSCRGCRKWTRAHRLRGAVHGFQSLVAPVRGDGYCPSGRRFAGWATLPR